MSKIFSLFIAMAIWFSIFSHLEKTKPISSPPVPGTIPIPKSPETPKPTIPLLSPPPPAIPGN
ncbi:MAG: hypothetical protein P1U89_02170 [Verrucomicrobiales bacterium]|nr:hypothetical protein [Verrucomicrobiales bacterium]